MNETMGGILSNVATAQMNLLKKKSLDTWREHLHGLVLQAKHLVVKTFTEEDTDEKRKQITDISGDLLISAGNAIKSGKIKLVWREDGTFVLPAIPREVAAEVIPAVILEKSMENRLENFTKEVLK